MRIDRFLCPLVWLPALILSVLDSPASAAGQSWTFRSDIAFSRDASFVGTSGDRVRIYEFKTGVLVREVQGQRTDCIAFSPVDQGLFAVAGEDSSLRLWRVAQFMLIFDWLV